MTDVAGANAVHFYAIHRQMRFDTRRYVDAVASATECDRAGRLRPLAKWAAGFGRELHLHHTVEDDHFFPALVQRLPEVGDVLAGLEHDHDVVAEILARWVPAAERLADPIVPFEDARAEVLELAVGLRDVLARHLDLEDELIVPRFAEAIPAAEFAELDDRVKRSIPKKGLSFALPWNVDALPEDARAELVATAPLILRVLYMLNVGRHRRLVAAAFDGVPEPALA